MAASETDHTNSGLNQIIRTIRLSQGQFTLILARSNYADLRHRIAEQIQNAGIGNIQEIRLPKTAITLFSYVQSQIEVPPPDGVMVFGLESVKRIDDVLDAANQVREEFRNHFRFPVILWVTDDVLNRFARLAPDFKSWAGAPVSFELTDDDMKNLLRHAVRIHASLTPIADDLSSSKNLRAFLNDIEHRNFDSDPELKADVQFLSGVHAQALGNAESAITHFQNSLSILEQSQNNAGSNGFCGLVFSESYRLKNVIV